MKREIDAVNGAIQYWKGFLDCVNELSKYGDDELDDKFVELRENSEHLIDDYKKRYNKLRRESAQPKERNSNENRRSKKKR